MTLDASTNTLYNLINVDYVILFVVFNSETGVQIGSKYKSNIINWVGQISQSMVIEGTKIYISYYWISRGILVYDTAQQNFIESYETSLSSFVFSSIFIYNHRLFIAGYDSSTEVSLLESGDLSKISIIPDISVSSFGMVTSPATEYVISSYSNIGQFGTNTAIARTNYTSELFILIENANKNNQRWSQHSNLLQTCWITDSFIWI